ncbi:MAG TPA: hypothetical protein VFH25_06150 [Nitrososphaeraceae archaeon]|nr:hypothetical protein [Nitrososphaeraceae archaeon]
MHVGIHEDKITKNNKHEHTALTEPANSQKESEKVTSVEQKKLSKVILIIDDDPDMTSIFSLGLQDEGFEVYTHNDPLEVLSQFRPNSMIYYLLISICPKLMALTYLDKY